MSRAFIFGYGFIGAAFAEKARAAGFDLVATARSADKRRLLERQGIVAVDPEDRKALRDAAAAEAVLITPAPDDDGCPAFRALHELIDVNRWIGYLSTTGVYGDRGGGWVFEDSAPVPTSIEGQRRAKAENQWLTKGAHLFRLPGLYGPGRNIIERLRDGTARHVHVEGHVFSRLHHDDCAAGLMASVGRPRPGRAYNLCDDKPASAEEVLFYAAQLTGLAVPPLSAFEDLPATTKRFYADNKRVANARAKAELGWRPAHPTYREGLDAIYRTLPTR
jgi:nucleoside-diphosphate-sugar epimerase